MRNRYLKDEGGGPRLSIVAVLVSGGLMLSACSKIGTHMQVAGPEASSPAPVSAPVATEDPLALPNGALENRNLVNYADAAMEFVKKDDFSPSFDDQPLVGRQFKVTVFYDKYDSTLRYKYDSEKQSLSVWLYPESNNHHDHQAYPDMDYLILQQEATVESPVPMSNAYGLTRDITPVHHRTFGIGSPRGGYMGVLPKDAYSSKDFTLYKALSKNITLAPDAAHASVADLAMDIEGVVIKPAGGHLITCTNLKTDATVNYTYQDTFDECVIAVKLTRIVVHSPALGVIADWHDSVSPHKSKVRHKS